VNDTLMESDAVESSGRTEGDTRSGRPCKKPKDLSPCESEESGYGWSMGREGVCILL
jgi:hypothetical protein